MARLAQEAFSYSLDQYFGCARKIGYASRKIAEDAATQQRKSGAPALKTYNCKFCGQWHIAKDRKLLGRSAA